jgi:peptidoglycan/LPS O-acetylase OafA/YrhL
MVDTFELTDAIKGIAMLTVLQGHYFNRYVSIDIPLFANGIIGVFFILSGYGLYHSFRKHPEIDIETTVEFYKKRAKRIYPLYWIHIALMIGLGVVFGINQSWTPFLNDILGLLAQLTGLPFLITNGHPWFVYAIIEIYLLAPIIFWVYRKYSVEKFLIGLVSFVAVANLTVLGFKVMDPKFMEQFIREFSYRWMFLGHFLLFGYGMSLPKLLDKYGDKIRHRSIDLSIIPLFIVMLAGIYFSYRPLFEYGAYPASGVFYASLAVLTALLIKRNYKNRLTSILQPVGKRSYSIYLLHIPFFIILHSFGVILEDSLLSITAVIILFPLFLKICELTQKTSYRLINY